jgi:hypothetical protein
MAIFAAAEMRWTTERAALTASPGRRALIAATAASRALGLSDVGSDDVKTAVRAGAGSRGCASVLEGSASDVARAMEG